MTCPPTSEDTFRSCSATKVPLAVKRSATFSSVTLAARTATWASFWATIATSSAFFCLLEYRRSPINPTRTIMITVVIIFFIFLKLLY